MREPDKCQWFPFSDEPLITALPYAPRFCDPFFLMPEESPDMRWHMFFHSWIGIHHFASDSGIAWEPVKMIQLRGHSPSVFKEDGKYYLIYEKHDSEKGLSANSQDKISRIEVMTSTDLVSWSKPRVIMSAANISFAGNYLKFGRISRPHIIKIGENYRMYFGASHLTLPDTNQKVSRYFAYAQSSELLGDYALGNYGKPIMEPDPDSDYSNLGCGGIKVVYSMGKFFAFQCGVYWDQEQGRTLSALFISKSDDGIHFSKSNRLVMLPTEDGWAGSYVKSCDVHYRPDENCWYCYFSATGNTKKGLFNDESIGLVIGSESIVPANEKKPENPAKKYFANFL